jgi:hypothetical protein
MFQTQGTNNRFDTDNAVQRYAARPRNRGRCLVRLSAGFSAVTGLTLQAGTVSIAAAQTEEAERARTGTVSGQVVHQQTRTPIAGVRLTLGTPEREAITDHDGRYVIENVPVGNYTVRFRLIGYRPHARTDVIVRSRRITWVDATMEPLAVSLQGVVVTGGYFPESETNPTSNVGFSGEEIRRAPGSAGDVSRIVASLPSVAKINDQTNSLIVRGGSPTENSFYVDNIEIPNINHFPTQGASGGPIGLLNVDFIDEVQFRTGGFSAAYGDRLSSIMDIAFRDGNRTEVDGQLDLNFAGFGGILEGPLPGSGGSWMLAARRSYLDLIINMVDVGSTVAPRYGDAQGKATLDLGGWHTLTVFGLFADDHMHSDSTVAVANAMVYFGDQDLWAGTAGINWRALWGPTISNTSLAYTGNRYDEEFFETNSGSALFRNRSTEQSLTLRNVNRTQLGSVYGVEFGAEAKHVTGTFDNVYAARFDPLGTPVPALVLENRIADTRLSAFASLIVTPVSCLTATLGARIDHHTATGTTRLSPRLALEYRLTDRTYITGATGIYYQRLPLVLLAQRPENGALGDPRAIHVVVGLSHRLAEHTRVTLEAYHKEYSRLPIDPRQAPLFVLDELFYDYGFFTNHERLTDSGRARSTGIEATLQKRLAQHVYGLVSAAYFRTKYRGADEVWRDRVFDNRVVFGVEGGYKPNRSWEFSVRWLLAGGPPYTPLDTTQSALLNRAVLDESQVNLARYPSYHSLNVRVDRRFYFSGSNLVVYLSVWNAYNRKNVASYYWNGVDGRQGTIYQWSALPIFGLEFEF